jgi:hypothetical protein
MNLSSGARVNGCGALTILSSPSSDQALWAACHPVCYGAIRWRTPQSYCQRVSTSSSQVEGGQRVPCTHKLDNAVISPSSVGSVPVRVWPSRRLEMTSTPVQTASVTCTSQVEGSCQRVWCSHIDLIAVISPSSVGSVPVTILPHGYLPARPTPPPTSPRQPRCA